MTATDTANSGPCSQRDARSTTVVAGLATTFLLTGLPATETAGTPQTLALVVEDAFGNIESGYTGTVHFTSTDPKATLPVDYTFKATDGGRHVFSNVVLDTAGPQSVTATDTGKPTLTATDSTVVTPATVGKIVVTGLPPTMIAGTPENITVTLEDAFGNVENNFTGKVHLSSTDAQATLPADYAFTGSDAGVHTFAGVILKTAGPEAVKADPVATPSVVGTDTTLVTAAATSQLVITQVPPQIVAGVMPQTMPVITAEDPYGNVTPSYTGTVDFTSTDPNATLPPDTTFDGKTGSITLDCADFMLVTLGTQSFTVTDIHNPSLTATATTSVVSQPTTIEAYVSCGVLYILGDANVDLVNFSLAPNDPGHSIVTNKGIALAGSPYDTTMYTSVVAIGGTGDMTLAIDASRGTPVPSGGLSFTGPSDNNTLVAPNLADDEWTITGPDTGTLNDPVTFSHIANLTGGNQTNYFTFQNGASVSGVIRGGAGLTTLDSTDFTLPLTNDVLTSGDLTIEGQTINVGPGVLISSRDVGAGNPETGKSLGDSGNIMITAPSANATVSTEFASTSPTITLSGTDSVLAEVEPGSLYQAGDVSITASAETDRFGATAAPIDTNLNANAVSVSVGTGSSIMGGAITVSASSQDMDLSSNLPNEYDSSITDSLLGMLKQLPDMFISSLTGIAGQVAYRHAAATVSVSGSTIVGSDTRSRSIRPPAPMPHSR